MLVDTDVLIWYMRGEPKAFDVIEGLSGFEISVVTYIELLQGIRNKRELNELQKALERWKARIIHIDERISQKAREYVEKHYLSHSLRLADSLIGATAIIRDQPLLTGNTKHYRIIQGLELKKFNLS